MVCFQNRGGHVTAAHIFNGSVPSYPRTMAAHGYNPDAVIRSAERALDTLGRMDYTSERIREAEQYLEQATDEAAGGDVYDTVEQAYVVLSPHEDYLEGTPIDPPGDILLLRNAVATLGEFAEQD